MINYGEEKSLRHVAMVPKCLDDNKPKINSKSKFALFQTSSILFNSVHLMCQMLAKFSGFNPKGPYLSLKKLKRNFFCCADLLRKAGAWNRKFHVAVVQRWLRNVQKMRDARESLLFC